ncbi:hypothetical protein T07_4382 [Trichinella nelsoni]|uniref:Uncharacterized protein n=1 Tax=Trichinella nelsoni TaxID=6336 RepID=A0A0V0SI70_9BILA|nr:hypothetical protein T07_4382 [Trichinella nelsoni]
MTDDTSEISLHVSYFGDFVFLYDQLVLLTMTMTLFAPLASQPLWSVLPPGVPVAFTINPTLLAILYTFCNFEIVYQIEIMLLWLNFLPTTATSVLLLLPLLLDKTNSVLLADFYPLARLNDNQGGELVSHILDKIHFFHYELEKLNIYLTKSHNFDVGRFGWLIIIRIKKNQDERKTSCSSRVD